jgi:hypothetical protein
VVPAARTGWAVETCHVVPEAAAVSAVDPVATAATAPVPTAAAGPPAWALVAGAVAAEAAAVVAEAAVAAADVDSMQMKSSPTHSRKWRTNMSPTRKESSFVKSLSWKGAAACACVLAFPVWVAAQSAPETTASDRAKVKTFDSPQKAVDALLDAAEKYDVAALEAIFGPEGDDIIHTGEPARDKKTAADFVAKAREKEEISIDQKTPDRALLVVGAEDWPFSVPIVKHDGEWFFDSKAGLQEILYRRIGGNELDAIQICEGYVEAQDDYAVMKRGDGGVQQYAQRIISTPGKQDGLAWKNRDGTWGGPIGENTARAIEQGYSHGDPYHGYYFKVLKGQGPAAAMGQMDYVLENVMIGGFALVAAPAQYRVTGVKTFIVNNDGVVYENDLGADTLEQFKTMELFNPDKTWQPVNRVAKR